MATNPQFKVNQLAKDLGIKSKDILDALAEKYADSHKISKHIIRPQYSLYGKAAPIVRNKKMVEIADEVLVIWDGKSKGSLATVKYAKEMNKNVNLITCEKTEN